MVDISIVLIFIVLIIAVISIGDWRLSSRFCSLHYGQIWKQASRTVHHYTSLVYVSTDHMIQSQETARTTYIKSSICGNSVNYVYGTVQQ